MVRPRREQRRYHRPGKRVRRRAHEAPRLGAPSRATQWALKRENRSYVTRGEFRSLPVRLAARRCWFVPRTLTAAPVEKRVEEPERRVGPRGCERLVLLFPRLRQDTVSLLPCADRLQGRLPPPRPRATPAHHISSGLVADIY